MPNWKKWFCFFLVSLFLIKPTLYANPAPKTSTCSTFFLAPSSAVQHKTFTKNFFLKKKFLIGASLLFTASLLFGFIFYPAYTMGILTWFQCQLRYQYLSPNKQNIQALTQEIQNLVKTKDPWHEITIFNVVNLRKRLLQKKSFSPEQTVAILGLEKTAAQIYLKHGVIVEGAEKKELEIILSFLNELPAAHVAGLHAIVYGVHSYDAIGRYLPFYESGIITLTHAKKEEDLKAVLAHEMGHSVWFHNLAYFEQLEYTRLFYRRSSEDNDYFSNYRDNPFEDFAEGYWRYTEDTKALVENSSTETKKKKLMMIANRFTFKKNGHILLKCYKNYQAIDVTIGSLLAKKNPPLVPISPSTLNTSL